MNAFEYLASLQYIHYHNLLLAKKYDGWQWAVEAYCPKDLKGKVWMVYLNAVINQEQIIYDIWRHGMRHKAIEIEPYDYRKQSQDHYCPFLDEYLKLKEYDIV